MRSSKLIITLALLTAFGGCSKWTNKPMTEQQAKEARQKAETHCKGKGYDFGSMEYQECIEGSLQESMSNQ